MMIRVLVCGKLTENGLSLLTQDPAFEVHVESNLTPEKLKEIIPLYDAMTVRSETLVTSDIIERANRLKVIVRSGIGTDNIDVKAATQKGVIVMNTPQGNMITTAEHAISMLLSLCRHIPQATGSLKQGKWEKKKFVGIEFFGKTLGVIGLGNVGRVVADRALGLKMKVLAYDPFVSKEMAEKLSVQLGSLEEVLRESDFVTIHVPLTEQTKNLLHKSTLALMKKGALLVQCARGGIVNEEDLYEVLKSGYLGGAALDVFVTEPPGQSPLFMLDNVICTPHLGASTDEAQQKVGIETAQQLMAYFKQGIVQNAVNLSAMTPERLKLLRPYLELADKLGAVQGQLVSKERLQSIEIEYHGEMTAWDVVPLTRMILKGFLMRHLARVVNEVNALMVAQDLGIDVKSTTSLRTAEFTNLISVTVRSNGKTSFVAGTIFNHTEPRFVQIDHFSMEAIPEGNMLLVRNMNRPGVIGNIGTVLGKNQVNISRFQLGLDKKKDEALSLINIDSPLSPAIRDSLLALPHIIEVKQLVF